MLSVILACALTSSAQEYRATLTGNITDPAGAAVAGATVTVRSQQTNLDTVVQTNDEGSYTVPFLQPGRYTVTVEKEGFKKAVSDVVELHTADRATMDVALEVGGVGETVNVTASAPLLEADTASRGQVVENLRVEQLPLNGRNPLNLATLATGVQFNGNPEFNRLFDNGDNVNFSINGGLNRHNEFLLDGAPNNAVTDVDGSRTRSVNNIAFVPPVDATDEFKVQTNAFSAEFGRTSGGVVNVTIKPGGREFHGSLYEFARRYQWEANRFGNNAQGVFPATHPLAGQERSPRFVRDPVSFQNLGGHKQDQYGFVVSGPVLIPRFGEGGKVFANGRDRTFFLLNVEFFKGIDPAANLSDVPTLLERQGNFSQSGVTIYDPLTTRPDPNNPGRFTRDPFPNNIIPANRINPIGQAIVNGFDLPNVGPATQRFNNFLQPFPGTDDFHSEVLRFDHAFTDSQRFFFRYVHNRRDQIQQGDNGRVGLGIDPQDPLVRVNNGAIIDWVSTLSPTTVLNTRVSFSRFLQAAFRSRSAPFDATSLGFPASFSNARPVSIVPRIEFSGDPYRAFGPRNPNSNITNTWSFPVSLTHIRGRHSIKIGGEYRDFQVHQGGGSFTWGGGFFRFSKDFTVRDPNTTNVNDQGSAIAALLLGYPSGDTRVENISQLSFHWGYLTGYIQDDFKVTPKLTLNLGLRYDYESPPVERFNRQNAGFGFDQASPLAAAVKSAPGAANCPACSNLAGGLLFAGVGGRPEEAFRKDRNNWGPRVGLAYQLNDRTVLRAGYGVFYFPQAEFGGASGFNINTPFTATVGGGANAFIPANTLTNPYPGGLLQPIGASQGLNTFLGQGLTVVDPDHVIPWVHQYSAGIQRELPWRMKLDVSYVGSRTRGILSGNDQAGGGRNLNVPTAQQIAQFQQNASFFNQSVANPLAGLVPNNGTLNASTISRRQLLLPFPQFTSVNLVGENVGKLWYDSGQASLEKRMSGGLTMSLSYTFSKQLGALDFLNPQDAEPTKAVTSIDSTHVFTTGGVLQLPFGRNRRWAGNIGRAAEQFVGGWDYNWVGQFRSGRPINLPTNALLLKDPTLGGASSFDRFFNNCVMSITTNSSGQQVTTIRQGVRVAGTTNTTFQNCTDPAWLLRNDLSNSLGNSPLRLPNLREPWAPIFDMSLNKSFHITEAVRFQLRFETFNTFNTPLFGSPRTDPTQNNFGILIPEQNVRNNANFRQVQLGGKFYF
ncbi:MAG TPA: TonB-dependent receptor [Pyrinomonadaceae bacterium]|nr:TonB-dependent receptor [Pyrinomonadaceae bacterium]